MYVDGLSTQAQNTDWFYAVDSILQSDTPLPSPKTTTGSRSASPIIFSNGRKSPFSKFLRSNTNNLATPPVALGPPSPELTISQDCAFPPFPTSRSRSATPTTPIETSAFNFSPNRGMQESTERNSAYAPLSPRSTGGGSVLQRMNSIAPGPFSQNGQPRPSGHEKTSSMSSSQDFIRPSSSQGYKIHSQKPSASSSNYTRNHSHSVSNASLNSKYTFDRSREEVPTIPAMPPPPRPSRPGDPSSSEKGTGLTDSGFDFGPFGPERRSNTFPREDDPNARSEEKSTFHRRPSEPSERPSDRGHKPRPSLAAAAMQPLHEIGSTSSFNASKLNRGRSTSQAPDRADTACSRSMSKTNARDDRRLQDAPPVPLPVRGLDQENTYHAPHESSSSDDSFNSGAKSGSSRSSPPLNDSPQRLKGQMDNTRVNNMFNGFQFDVENGSALEEAPLSSEDLRGGPLKPRPTIASVNSSPRKPSPAPREDPPARYGTPALSPDEYVVSSFAPQSNNLRVSPVPIPTAPRTPSPRRPSKSNKGNCRGCGELIRGKSVSSADGRLTGHYHKQCFVCKTCQAPFQTADFYVMHNNPYCARHYHELNNSLCTKCDRGIEGQYLETEQRLKFHPHCFSCQECHRILRDDYFEWNGRTLCEQHAFRAAQQPSSLGPGRRYPERRTTRLMMM